MSKVFNPTELLRPNIASLKPYSSARDEFSGTAKVQIDANENPFATNFNRYPDPYQLKLKSKISSLKLIPSNQIFLGNGSDEVIDLLFRAFCIPSKDNVIVLPPTYGMYSVSAGINDTALREVPLTEGFQLDLTGIFQSIDSNTKIIFICSPNNPTGNCIRREDIIKVAQTFNGIVVVDEAYIDFSETSSAIELLNEFPNLLISQTFSKAWGLAGIRLGMGFASEEIISILNSIKPPYNINSFSQNEALNAINNQSQTSEKIQYILKERKSLAADLSELSCVKEVFPSDANFLLVRVSDANKIYTTLMRDGIIVRNRTNVILCDQCLRITVGLKSENQLLIEAMKKF